MQGHMLEAVSLGIGKSQYNMKLLAIPYEDNLEPKVESLIFEQDSTITLRG